MAFKGQVYYFSIAESPERHSTVWRLWSPANKGDVYLGARFVADRHKLSVHESGLRLLREKSRDGATPIPPTLRWFGPGRATPGYEIVWNIVTPFGCCREAKLHPRFKDRVTWIPQWPVPFTATQLSFVLSFGMIHREDEWPFSHQAECLLRWRLGSGETLFLLRFPIPLAEAKRVAWGRELIRTSLPADGREGRRGFDHRLHLIQDDGSYRGCVDLAYDV